MAGELFQPMCQHVYFTLSTATFETTTTILFQFAVRVVRDSNPINTHVLSTQFKVMLWRRVRALAPLQRNSTI